MDSLGYELHLRELYLKNSLFCEQQHQIWVVIFQWKVEKEKKHLIDCYRQQTPDAALSPV